jgi:hypothetical protein
MFQPAQNVGPQLAIVYLYFPLQKGWADHHTILANEATVTRLDAEGYYPFVVPSGWVTLAMEGWPEDKSVKINVERGRTYFVRVSLVGTSIYSRYYRLEVVDADRAMDEISNCRLMMTCQSTQGCTRNAVGQHD